MDLIYYFVGSIESLIFQFFGEPSNWDFFGFVYADFVHFLSFGLFLFLFFVPVILLFRLIVRFIYAMVD